MRSRAILGSTVLAILCACGGGGGGGAPSVDARLVGTYTIYDFFYSYADSTSLNLTDFDYFDTTLVLSADGRYSATLLASYLGTPITAAEQGWWSTGAPTEGGSDGTLYMQKDGTSCTQGSPYSLIYGDPDVYFLDWTRNGPICTTGKAYVYYEEQFTRVGP